MAIRESKDTELTTDASPQRDDRDDRDDRDETPVQPAPIRPELRTVAERIIGRNRAGLTYLAEH